MVKQAYEVIIVGAGAAGLSAAIYTCRRKLKTLILSIDVGGQTLLTSHIENYPGVMPTHGMALMKTFEEQAISFGASIIRGRVVSLEKKGENFFVCLSNGERYETRVVLLAYGKVPRRLGIPGEEKFIGRGISHYAAIDTPLYEDKIVAVIGGGNSAIDAALLLSKLSKKVYIIHRREEFRAEAILVERLNQCGNVELLLNSLPREFSGVSAVTSLIIENLLTNKLTELTVDGVFTEIGLVADTDLVKHLVKINEKNEIIVDEKNQTSCPGIFAAGDITPLSYKQTIISAGDGAKAALSVYSFLTGKRTVIDWTH